MSDPSSEPRVRQRHVRRDDDPVFGQSMAAAFFDTTSENFRRKEIYFLDRNGDPLIIHREGPKGIRKYSLNDILRIAHALRRLNKMTDRQLRLIVLRVDAFREPIKKHRRRYRKGDNP